MDYFTIIGWLGVVFFVTAYLLLSLEILSAKKTVYHWLNFLGALCLVLNAIAIKDNPTIVVNGIWGLIAVFTVLKIYKKKML
ncbi:CBU_0592 family membrane protein [Tenacibaculum agarivorans]|uniref:CBU_0592 family membrane protein n=1 Tax=Tenacibaculum agarivorans TaxID=1908389 RepID=UPI00094BA309|nr:hypothetical protein [Tenacibaculum agarivorans]